MPGTVIAPPSSCRNCGSPVEGEYCGECGQSRRDLDRSVWDLTKEFLEEAFRLEGRAYRTLRLLAGRPGEVTADYLAGRRVRYSPPLRLYLASSAAFIIGYRLTRPVDEAYFEYRTGGDAYYDTLANVLILLLPLLALLLKLLYARSGRPLIHHFVFSLHTGAASLLWVLVLVLTTTGLKAWWGVHSAALRRTFGSGWAGSAIRSLVLAAGMGVGYVVMFWVLAIFDRLS